MNNKICFICCYRNEEQYYRMVESINNLSLPNGYELETYSVTEADSIFEAYNAVMKQSDAKYKVYVSENVRFIKSDLLIKAINVFQNNDKIGMLGVAGSKTVPQSGKWQESDYKYGMYLENNKYLRSFNSVTKDYEYVKIIDGSVMLTQYDVLWREDIFNGYSFYEVSHSLEYAKLGYEVGVIKQDEPYTEIKIIDRFLIDESIQQNQNALFKNYWNLAITQFYKFGTNSFLGEDCELVGGNSVYIGNNVFIKKGSWFNVPFNLFKGEPQIIIDDGCQIGRFLIVNAANKVYIGKNVLFGPNVYISDCNHKYIDITVPIMFQGVSSLNNIVYIDDNCWIGANVVIVGNLKIGKGSVIGANSLVNSDIPDYCVAVGNPAKVIKAYDCKKKQWVKVTNDKELKAILLNR